MKLKPFWIGETSETSTSADIPRKVDVVVLGGGFTGLSSAYHLALGGANVALLESGLVGTGASSRNGGMVLTGLKEDVLTLRHKYGLEKARALFSSSLDAIGLVRTLVGDERDSCGFHQSGHLEMAAKQSHFDHMLRVAEELVGQHGHPVQMITREDQQSEIGSGHYYGGMLDNASCCIQPWQYVKHLVKLAKSTGVVIVENTPATRITRIPAGYSIQTKRGVVECERIILATGAYTQPNLNSTRQKFFEIGSFIGCTRPLPGDLAKTLIPNRRMVFDTNNHLVYFRLTDDDRLLFGGRAAFGMNPERSLADSIPVLQNAMARTYPILAGEQFEHAWAGSLDVTVGKLPVIHDSEGITTAIGFAGHGVAMASLFGKLISRQLLFEERSLYHVTHLPSVPLPWFRPIYLPFVGAYYQWMDKWA